MGPLDFFWHLANLLAVPLLFGLTAATGARLLWRRGVGHWPWWRLALALCLSAAAVAVAGLVVLGRDGRMATYAFIALSGAVVLGWVGRRQLLA